MQPRKIVLLGSTGSIGTQAIDVVDGAPHLFEVVALSAGGGNLELLARQAVHTRAQAVGTASGDAAALQALIDDAARAAGVTGYRPEIITGPDASTRIAGIEADVVLNGITGSIGLAPTLAALKSGATLALANKESLIVGGALVKAAAREGQIVPVDSEHSAIAQCLRSGTAAEVDRLILTASGGPFRGKTREELHDVSPQDALAHPTWDMGLMVTTNSASLVNKGLEVIEAHLLFDIPLDRIDVVVHPQSVVHSMVQFIDGSTDRPGLPAGHAPAHRPRPGLAGPRPRLGPAVRLDPGHQLDLRAAGHRGVPRRRTGEGCRQAGEHLPGCLQRRERGGRDGVPCRPDPLHRHRRYHRSSTQRTHRVLRADGGVRAGC